MTVPPGGRRPVGRAWVAASGLPWALGAGLVLLALGTLTGRPDIAVLGLAPVLGSLWAAWSRPRGEVWVDVRRAPDRPAAAGELR